jgi:hypothetical protein
VSTVLSTFLRKTALIARLYSLPPDESLSTQNDETASNIAGVVLV